VFIPLIRLVNPLDKRLLIINGHGSHITDDYIWEAFSNNIYIIYLPAHTFHVLQPLDLSIFSPLKRAYRKRLKALLIKRFNDSSVAGKRSFLECYYSAR